MSWDISVMASASPPLPLEQMPTDWCGDPLGSPAEVRQKISAILPEVDWSDPNWGMFRRDGFSFEFNLSEEAPCYGFAIHVRGGGPAVKQLLKLAESTGWYLLDTSTMEWLHHCKDPGAGWDGFQAYRDKIVSQPQRGAEPASED